MILTEKLVRLLHNIFKELYDDLGIKNGSSGDLTPWAKEGVLLLNSVLTVRKDMPASHKDLGWNLLTDHIIKLLNEQTLELDIQGLGRYWDSYP